MSEKKTFDYSYSAEKNEEIKAIKRKYNIDQQDESDQDQMLKELRRLDSSTTRLGTILSLVLGIIGTLITGTGMSLAMVSSDRHLALGVVIGVVGLAVAMAAYPVYKSVTRRKREENAPKIKELADQLLEDKQ